MLFIPCYNNGIYKTMFMMRRWLIFLSIMVIVATIIAKWFISFLIHLKKQFCEVQVCAVFNCCFDSLGGSTYVGLSQMLILFWISLKRQKVWTEAKQCLVNRCQRDPLQFTHHRQPTSVSSHSRATSQTLTYPQFKVDWLSLFHHSSRPPAP